MKCDLSQPIPSPPGVGLSSCILRTVVVVLGGDARQAAVVRALTEAGLTVYVVGLSGAPGLPGNVRRCASLSACLRLADEIGAPDRLIILLPLPVSRDGETVHCPLEPTLRIQLTELIDVLDSLPTARLMGGCLPTDFRAALAKRLGESGLRERVVDYYELETVQIPNARITAEAAIMTAMELTDTSLLGSRMAVIGYGRIGQFLARLLLSLGASVTVCARREESLAFAQGDGCSTIALHRGKDPSIPLTLAHGYDVLFNTVPAPVLSRQILEKTDPRTLILDLASAPGGVDPEAAALFTTESPGETSGSEKAFIPAGRTELPWSACLRIIRAPSLPGRYAPATAGKVLADAILPLIAEKGDSE